MLKGNFGTSFHSGQSVLNIIGGRILPPTWGNMMTGAQSLFKLKHQYWLWLPPGLTIGLTVIAVNFIGDGLRDALDPRTRIEYPLTRVTRGSQ